MLVIKENIFLVVIMGCLNVLVYRDTQSQTPSNDWGNSVGRYENKCVKLYVNLALVIAKYKSACSFLFYTLWLTILLLLRTICDEIYRRFACPPLVYSTISRNNSTICQEFSTDMQMLSTHGLSTHGLDWNTYMQIIQMSFWKSNAWQQ